MSAKQPIVERDRHGFRFIEPHNPGPNPDIRARWNRRWRFYLHIKAEVEPLRRQLIAANRRIDRI